MFVFIDNNILDIKFSASKTNTLYTVGYNTDIYVGQPDILWNSIAFIKNEQKIWTHGVFFNQPDDLSNLITTEQFQTVRAAAENAIAQGSLGKINGQSLENGADITFDLSLYKIVSSLPTDDIQDNKIYLVRNIAEDGQNIFDEYLYNSDSQTWEILGQYKQEINLDNYYTKAEADKKYVQNSTNNKNVINTDKNGALSNFSDNGQAYLAVRPKTDFFLINTPYAGASFGVKDDGTAAFSHKTYTSYNKTTGAYAGAVNTAVLQFAGPTGLRYAKNTGTSNDVSQDMYKYVGVIDSPDDFQRVYSAKQVDALLEKYQAKIDKLTAAIIALGGTVDTDN